MYDIEADEDDDDSYHPLKMKELKVPVHVAVMKIQEPLMISVIKFHYLFTVIIRFRENCIFH